MPSDTVIGINYKRICKTSPGKVSPRTADAPVEAALPRSSEQILAFYIQKMLKLFN